MARRAFLLGATLAFSLSASGVAEAGQALDAFAAAWSKVSTYSATITMHETKGSATQDRVYQFSFTKPNQISLHIDAGDGAGNNAVWSGGDTVTAFKSSMAMFKKNVGLNDPLVTTLRGEPMTMLSFGWVLNHIQTTKGDLTEATGPTFGGQATTRVALQVANPASDDGITWEIAYLSNATHLPVRVERYAGTTLIAQVAYDNVKIGS